MAYTSVIPVRRLDRTVDYVQNKGKTTPKSLEEAVGYAKENVGISGLIVNAEESNESDS